jgi:hypothetical protein
MESQEGFGKRSVCLEKGDGRVERRKKPSSNRTEPVERKSF